MHKQKYLEAVSPFVDYLTKAWDGSFSHIYEIRDRAWLKYRHGQKHWEITNLRQAFDQYWWDGDYQKAVSELANFCQQWEAAKAKGDQAAGCEAILNIFKWGGVLNKHTGLSVAKISDIFGHIEGALQSLGQGMDNNRAFRQDGFRMNSAYTKIYAVLDDRFIIYDGRVGSALGLLAREYLLGAHVGQHETMVPLLAFPFKKERNSTGKYIRAVDSTRNPSNERYTFRQVKDDADHAKWMLRASWIIEEVLARLSLPGVTSRHIEAALFMVGYHVSVKK